MRIRKRVIYYCFTTVWLIVLQLSLFAQVDFVSSDIPIVIIETQGKEILDTVRIVANMGIIDNGVGTRNYLTDPCNGYNGKISIELRGSTSLSFPKKQYGLETQNVDRSNNNVSLLGLPSENDWILYAPYSDKSLIRNVLAYTLSERLGHYAPRSRFCEVVLNGDYVGVYLLVEKIKRDQNRVDISKLEPHEISGDDLTGGYIVKIDKTTGSSCYSWKTEIADVYFQNEYPDCEKIAPEQKKYIEDYINLFEAALFSDSFSDPINGYRQYVNLDSFIDYLMVNEISKNIDAYRLSTFMYKDKESKGGRLTCGPVWDYNVAFANVDYLEGYTSDGFIATRHVWWDRLLMDTTFNNALKARWCTVRKQQFSNTELINTIDSLTGYLEESHQRNFQRWDILGSDIWPNYYIGQTYENEIQYLKSWIFSRLDWLDNNLPGTSTVCMLSEEYETGVFPNPFDFFFRYAFSLPEAGNVTLHLFDANGRLITNIIRNVYYETGKHQITWNGFDTGNLIPGGFYLVALKVNGRIVSTNKIIKK